MKKLLFMLVAVAAVSFASCGGNTPKDAQNDSTAADSNATEAVAADSNAVAGDSTTTPAPAAADSTANVPA